MDHDDAVLKLADHHKGRLSPEDAAGVAAHLAGCAECRETTGSYAAMEAAFVHPSSAEIVELALGARPPRAGDPVARHLESCAACADEVRAVREANAPAPVRSRSWLPLAASIAVVAVSAVAYRNAQRSADLARRIDAADARAETLARELAATSATARELADVSGAVSYLALGEATRGVDRTPTLVLRPGQTHAFLALAIEVPAVARRPGEGCRIVLLGPGNTERWSSHVEPAALEGALKGSDSLLVRIPAARFETGRHRIEVVASSGTPTWLDASFDVVSGP
ncbi:MAG TPA: zf-HC2 domain-containing protein [Candidatus Polarisedimenticolaceae bacterium]|nr:zf-HC2 domain-containing protein [Candidatus Polarisedimenticolaceae bacterium]